MRATLQREKHWADWKRGGCVAFDMAAVELSGQKRKAGGAAGRSKRMQLGNASLTKLWNMGSNSLEVSARVTLTLTLTLTRTLTLTPTPNPNPYPYPYP